MPKRQPQSNGLSKKVEIIDGRVVRLELLAERQQNTNDMFKTELGKQTVILEGLKDSEQRRVGVDESRTKSLERIVKLLQLVSFLVVIAGAMSAAFVWFSHHV